MKYKRFYGGVLTLPLDFWGAYEMDYSFISERFSHKDNKELISFEGSSVNKCNFLPDFLSNLDPKPIDVIEIGTFVGLGSAVLASYCRTVFTFDIWYRNAHHLWRELGLDNRINSYCGPQEMIDYVINMLKSNENLDFNFAFIDGMHKIENVRHEFEMLKFCKRILFHDANVPEIGDFILNEIGGQILDEQPKTNTQFGYWEEH